VIAEPSGVRVRAAAVSFAIALVASTVAALATAGHTTVRAAGPTYADGTFTDADWALSFVTNDPATVVTGDHMPDGGALLVSAEVRDHEAHIRVCDTGCGIPQAHIDKIFDPFYTTSAIGKGAGLGLSICYSIVKQHSGTIEVESIEGKGSTFTVRLPIK